jgi:hypothetical protein
MTDSGSTQNSTNQSTVTPKTLTSPLRCFVGALISASLTTGLYSLTAAIAQSFAAKPSHSHNVIVLNITVAVRTLVVGMCALGTGIFGLVAVGLVALGIQVLIQQQRNHKAGNA